jgi:hypothetical protein
VNTLQEKDRIINSNSPLYEEFAIDELPMGLTSDDDFPPCTSSAADCCDTSDPSSITIGPCTISDNKDVQATLNCQGRLLTIRVILKCVCPNKNIAVGVLLFDQNDIVKGFEVKEILTPPLPTDHPGENCEHVVVCKFCFVLPSSICCPLTLKPKVIAHYTNFSIDSCSEVCPTDLPGTCC